ncbi:MAG: hypothetical protein IJS45_01615 [Clostridia bacterium]|nr:hypothetical protein [Clostridia bacterium]
MRAYTVTLISVSAAASLIIMLFSGSRYEKILRSAVYVIIAVCAISPIAGLLGNDGLSSIEYEVRDIENKVDQNTVKSCIREIKNRCRDLIIDQFPDTVVSNIEIGYEGNSPEELNITSFEVYVSGVDDDELCEYLNEALKFDDVKVYEKET